MTQLLSTLNQPYSRCRPPAERIEAARFGKIRCSDKVLVLRTNAAQYGS